MCYQLVLVPNVKLKGISWALNHNREKGQGYLPSSYENAAGIFSVGSVAVRIICVFIKREYCGSSLISRNPADVIPCPTFGADQQHAEVLATGGDPDKRGVESTVVSTFLAFPEFITDSDMDDIS